MWIDALTIDDLTSYRKTAVTFERGKPIALFIGRNAQGKTNLASAIELAVSGEVLRLRGTGLSISALIRGGAAGGFVEISTAATPDSKPVKVRRRVAAKGVTTWVNGSPTTKAAFDLFTAIHGDADPAAVIRTLANISGFFELAATPEETARRQKALLLGLVDQRVPQGAFEAWPLDWGAIPATFADVAEAYDVASARLTALRAERAAVTWDPEALTRQLVTDALIEQIETQLRERRGERDRRVTAQGEAAGRRTELEATLVRQRELLDNARAALAEAGDRAAVERRVDAGNAIADDLAKHHADLQERKTSQARVDGQRAELQRRRQQEARRLERAAGLLQKVQEHGAIPELEAALAAARVDAETTRVELEEVWTPALAEMGRLRAAHQALQASHDTLEQHEHDSPCSVCRRVLTARARRELLAWYDGELARASEALAKAERELGPKPDVAAAEARVRECQDRLDSSRDAHQEHYAAQTALTETDEHLAVLPAADPQIGELETEVDRLEEIEQDGDEAAAELEGLDACAEQVAAHERSISDAETALAALPPADPEIEALAGRIAIGERRLQEAREQKTARATAETAKHRADQLDAEITTVGALREQLGPKGIRERLLIERLDALTGRVNEVLGHFGLTLTFQAEPWKVLINGRPPALAAETEAMRAGLAFQVALAEVTGAKFLLADRIGNFDAGNRGTLFTVLQLGLEKGWLEQAFLFSTYTTAAPPAQAPGETVALYHVSRPGPEAPTTIARVA